MFSVDTHTMNHIWILNTQWNASKQTRTHVQTGTEMRPDTHKGHVETHTRNSVQTHTDASQEKGTESRHTQETSLHTHASERKRLTKQGTVSTQTRKRVQSQPYNSFSLMLAQLKSNTGSSAKESRMVQRKSFCFIKKVQQWKTNIYMDTCFHFIGMMIREALN